MSHRDWLRRLALRIGRALRRTAAQAGGAEPREMSTPPVRRRAPPRAPLAPVERTAYPAPDGTAGAAEGADAGAGELAASWRLALDGETAPRELLDAWALRSADTLAGPSRASRPGVPPAAPSGGRSRIPVAAAAPSPAAPMPPGAPLAPGSPRSQAPLFAPPVPAATVDPDGALPQPPSSLPPFFQARSAGDGAARRPEPGVETVLPPPCGPAAPPADDLSALAAKLQRILDEEARRHGIPV